MGSRRPLRRHPGFGPASRFFVDPPMERRQYGGWVYIMADRYRGAMYVGVTADLAARIHQHRSGVGSDFCARYGLTRLVRADRVDDIGAGISHESG